jgi:2'-5' RNA ligase
LETPVTEPNEAGCTQGSINSFALVCYLPSPLRDFLDALRRELSPECRAKAHVTVLPPRPLSVSSDEARRELRNGLAEFQSFSVELGEVEVFPSTHVVYISVLRGVEELHRMHVALNAGGLQFCDLFPYHPHVTLAQDLSTDRSAEAAGLARRQWKGAPVERAFRVERMTFVQNSAQNTWRDLDAWDLSTAPKD